MSGMEMMLKSMGLGPALDGVKQLVESGALGKLESFADGMDELVARQAEMEKKIEAIYKAVCADAPVPTDHNSDRSGAEFGGRTKPGPDTGAAGGLVAVSGPARNVSGSNGAD